MDLKDWNNFKKEKLIRKVIMNMFICSHGSPNWKESVGILKSIEFPTNVEYSHGHHRGLAIQVLLDTDIEESKKFCKELLNKFPEMPLIVIAEVNVKIKNSPIGHWYDVDLIQPGRYFDKLIKEGKTGLIIHDENTPKIIKNHE
jgi:hypothetical protein